MEIKRMATKLLKEVEFIDGVKEFLEEGYVVELLAKSANSFKLTGTPIDETERFSGDVTLFNKRVYKKEDLTIVGSYYIEGQMLYINPTLFTSEFTYTYITYKKKATSKKEGLFSVDYKRGYLYTSTPIKNVQIDYKYAVQYAEGQKMTQVSSREYTKETIYNIPVDDKTKLSYLYQLRDKTNNNNSKEFYKGGRVNLVTLGDTDD